MRYVFVLIVVFSAGVIAWMIIPPKTKIKFVSTHYELNERLKSKRKGQVFKSLDYNKGNFTLYLFIGEDDYKMLKKHNKISNNCIQTDNINIIKNVLSKLDAVKESGGDMATVNSYIILKKNNKTLYCSGVLYNKQEIMGLQNEYCGACFLSEPIRLDFLKHFSNYKVEILEI